MMDMLGEPEAPARRGYHAISHAPGPRTQWRIRPHCPDQKDWHARHRYDLRGSVQIFGVDSPNSWLNDAGT